MNFEFINTPSPNFNERADSAIPSILLLHYTGMESGPAALERLRDPQAEVSAHYLVEEDGSIYRLVHEEQRAWHAGKSCWRGLEDINSHSIGIEIVNPGHDYGYRAFPLVQMEALAGLCRDIARRHNIAPDNILAHSDVAPARKRDPGELFDWRLLAQNGIGLWPRPEEQDYAHQTGYGSNPVAIESAFQRFGYETQGGDLATVIKAFQRHYHPEIFQTPEAVGRMNRETAARLQWLLRHRSQQKKSQQSA